MADLSAPILVVDDHPDILLFMSTLLEMEGQQVVTATNGAEAFDKARQHQPWLIILDLMMPVMSGEEFRRAQLASPDIRDIPVLVVSARHDAPEVARRMKALRCMGKPLDVDTLVRFVRQHRREPPRTDR